MHAMACMLLILLPALRCLIAFNEKGKQTSLLGAEDEKRLSRITLLYTYVLRSQQTPDSSKLPNRQRYGCRNHMLRILNP
jgi:hypothetical protein